MSVVQHPTKGPEWWHVKYYPRGKKGGLKVESIGPCSYSEALKHEKRLRIATKSKRYETEFKTFNDVVCEYIQHYRIDHLDSGVAVVERYLSIWGKHIGSKQLALITQVDIERYILSRQSSGISPATINKELSAVSGLLKWSKKRNLILSVIDIDRFPAKKTKAPLPDVPTREEVLSLINCMVWPRCGLFFCLYYGGLRSSEARFMMSQDVFLDRGVMIVRGKGNKQRVVPIVEQLRPVLTRRIAEVGYGYLWTTKTGQPISDLKKIIKLAKERAGLTRHIYPHLLRHAFGTHATMNGVNLRHLQNIMGHTTAKTTEIYTTLSADALVSELSGKFGKI